MSQQITKHIAGKSKQKTNKALLSDKKRECQQGFAFPRVYFWRDHPSVWFVVFDGRHSLRLACARQSVFLEDHELAGCVLDQTPRASDHAAAEYSGHNFTLQGMLRFASAAGENLSPPEETLLIALAEAGALSDQKGTAPLCAGVVAIGKGLSRQECENTLVHECMHGLFYGHLVLRNAVEDYWRNMISSTQQNAWVHFLMNLGYNAKRDEEIAVNELLAYMCTEKQLFRDKSPHVREVCEIRDGFVAAIQQHVPFPAPSVGQAGCVWAWASSVAKTQGCKNRSLRRK